MQAEILAANPASAIRILAVNDVGEEGSVALAAGAEHVIPILQDTLEVGAWGAWNVTYRDVVILDGEGKCLGVYNLTEHNLGLPSDYADLLAFLRLAAGE